MPKGYNSLNNIPVNFYEIGLCPVCSRRLTAECEHRNEQSEVWYAAQILAEQELFTATVPDDSGLPFLALSDTVSIAITPKVARFMDAPAIVDTASASTPKEQTYQEFQKLAEKYAPKPFIPKPNCEHKNEYATRGGMMCRDCHKTREAVTDFEKRLVSKLTPRANGYVNYGMR